MSPKFDRKKSMTPLNDENHENGVQTENRPTVVSAHAEYAGPIPPAEEFAKYGQVIPDAPERILSVFEKDSEHVRHMNSESLKAEYNTNKRSQWMAFLCIMAGFFMTAFCIWMDKEIAAILGGLATFILAVGGIFSAKK